ncbi:hypothetical protein GX48_05594 [Paracoccidioides brasiliensis]|nr:hypothetical protein GX48_05594 [Paracoccidioides brasiliensis]
MEAWEIAPVDSACKSRAKARESVRRRSRAEQGMVAVVEAPFKATTEALDGREITIETA